MEFLGVDAQEEPVVDQAHNSCSQVVSNSPVWWLATPQGYRPGTLRAAQQPASRGTTRSPDVAAWPDRKAGQSMPVT
jgi:2-C-methyl-D-erythritol 4-phosphate cytidylyltransferase